MLCVNTVARAKHRDAWRARKFFRGVVVQHRRHRGCGTTRINANVNCDPKSNLFGYDKTVLMSVTISLGSDAVWHDEYRANVYESNAP